MKDLPNRDFNVHNSKGKRKKSSSEEKIVTQKPHKNKLLSDA